VRNGPRQNGQRVPCQRPSFGLETEYTFAFHTFESMSDATSACLLLRASSAGVFPLHTAAWRHRTHVRGTKSGTKSGTRSGKKGVAPDRPWRRAACRQCPGSRRALHTSGELKNAPKTWRDGWICREVAQNGGRISVVVGRAPAKCSGAMPVQQPNATTVSTRSKLQAKSGVNSTHSRSKSLDLSNEDRRGRGG
jgi:hypothetical protein